VIGAVFVYLLSFLEKVREFQKNLTDSSVMFAVRVASVMWMTDFYSTFPFYLSVLA
jgi:hypothetical protein